MDDLDKFLTVLYEGLEGFIYTPIRTQAGEWKQQFYHWPEEQQSLKAWIQTNGIESDVYICPSIFAEKSARKQSVRGSQVAWVEFDGQGQIDLDGLPGPNVIVQTSVSTHVHIYWRIPFSPPQVVESINRRLTYGLEADSSGWDANQVLRPPLTRNFKHGLEVKLLGAHRNVVDHTSFDKYPEPPQLISFTDITTLPDPVDVLAVHSLSTEVWQMLAHPEQTKGLRSTFLMHLGYELVEAGLKHEEVVSLLIVADEKVGKFVGRQDRLIRLAEIASIAIGKLGAIEQFPIYNYGELLSLELSIEHLWGDLLTRTGSLMLCGEPGVGKTQFAFYVATSLCLGSGCLARKISEPQRILFFSLEMGDYGCKYIIGHQSKGLSAEQRAILAESFFVVPNGFPMSLSEMDKIIKDVKPTGIFIDTLTDTAEESLSDENQAKRILSWDSRIRAKQGAFTWWNHHTRKPSGDNKAPTKIGDIYGSYLYGAKMDSIMFLYGSKDNKSPIKWIRPKNRYGTIDREGTDLVRTDNLTFALKNNPGGQGASDKSGPSGSDGFLTIDF